MAGATAVPPGADARPSRALPVIGFALCACFYFVQYALRSAPGVMGGDLARAFGIDVVAVGALAASSYYTYALFSLVAGASLDRFGARAPVPVGTAILAMGAVLFASGGYGTALTGRLLQGAGSAFAFTGAVYVATVAFPSRWLALAVGIAQGTGMFGAWAGQTLVSGALRAWDVPWRDIWLAGAMLACIIALGMLPTLPARAASAPRPEAGLAGLVGPYRVVFANPQTWLCGICAGLLFMPTSIGDLIWHVPYFTKGFDLGYGHAVFSVSMVPLGWIVGAPLLGWISDRMGRRRPVILAGAAVLFCCVGAVMFGPVRIATNWVVNLLFGVASGVAIVPYSVAKEANPDTVKGSATGAMNLIVFALVALLAPLHGWVVSLAAGGRTLALPDFREMGLICLCGVALALLLAGLLLRETGTARR